MAKLNAIQCLDRLIGRFRQRIAILEAVNLVEYRVAVAELETAIRQAEAARGYLEGEPAQGTAAPVNDSSKVCQSELNRTAHRPEPPGRAAGDLPK